MGSNFDGLPSPISVASDLEEYGVMGISNQHDPDGVEDDTNRGSGDPMMDDDCASTKADSGSVSPVAEDDIEVLF